MLRARASALALAPNAGPRRPVDSGGAGAPLWTGDGLAVIGPIDQVMTVISNADWLDGGRTRAELRAALREGEVVRLRRGVVADTRKVTPESLHRLKIQAAAPLLGPSTYFAHESAAVLHELPLLPGRLSDVVAVRTGGGHGAVTGTLHARRAVLAASDVTVVDGLAVTSLDRTLADLARRLPFAEAVMIADAALRRGASRAAALERSRVGRGCRMAERALVFADARSESAGESLSRVQLLRARVPLPVLQHAVVDRDGALIARLDFWWEDHRLAGEFDGLAKYTRLLRAGESTEQAILAEKRREQRLCDLGIRVIRWTWADAMSAAFVPRVAAALRCTPVESQPPR